MQTTEIARTADGRELAFCQWGPPDGTPVFYLHGMPGSRYFRHPIDVYDRAGVRVITFDRPGYGRSTRAPGRAVAQGAGDIATIANHLGIDHFAVIGESGGGPYALAAAAALPHRVRRFATVMGVGPHDAPDLDPMAGLSVEDIEEWRAVRTGEWLDGPYYQATRDWIEAFSKMTEVPRRKQEMVVEAIREGLRPGPYGLSDDLVAAQQPWGFDVSTVLCPAKVMIARDDVNVPPAQGKWLAAHLPTAEEIWVDGDHFAARDEPVQQLLAWLASGISPSQPDPITSSPPLTTDR